jgi:hypothetical protein
METIRVAGRNNVKLLPAALKTGLPRFPLERKAARMLSAGAILKRPDVSFLPVLPSSYLRATADLLAGATAEATTHEELYSD